MSNTMRYSIFSYLDSLGKDVRIMELVGVLSDKFHIPFTEARKVASEWLMEV